MHIGVIGCGVVGSACKFGFEKLGHTTVAHDIKLKTRLSDVLETEVSFIAVPTLAREDGSCDTSIVESVVKELCEMGYKGVIAIKSTITPGTTEKLIVECGNDRICFVPEFLRERCAISDMVEQNKLLAIGTRNDKVYEIVKESHGKFPQNHVKMTPTQAEVLKYMHNSFNALRVIFANEMYAICSHLGEEYTPVKDAFLHTSGVQDIYLDCNQNMRGYAGVCLPKDVANMKHFVEMHGIDARLFEVLDSQNKKLIKTVPPGMRIA